MDFFAIINTVIKLQLKCNKRLSYRRETALQDAL